MLCTVRLIAISNAIYLTCQQLTTATFFSVFKNCNFPCLKLVSLLFRHTFFIFVIFLDILGSDLHVYTGFIYLCRSHRCVRSFVLFVLFKPPSLAYLLNTFDK